MTGVGENRLPLELPVLPCVMINPRVPVATKDVFQALGLKPGDFRVGVTDVLTAPAWPGAGAPVSDWVKVLGRVRNDLEPPALKVQPIIRTVLDALRASPGVLLARMSGSGATCFAIYGSDSDAKSAGVQIASAHPEWWVHAGTLS
jgi:4-diphosphocytidyl-2-C-methyl-D-erythritol kinase